MADQERDPEGDPLEGTRMSLGEHIDELRSRLIRGLAAVMVVFLVCWFLRDTTTEIVQRPMYQALGWIDRDQVEKYEAKLAADPTLSRSEFFLTDDPSCTELRPSLTVTQRPQALSFTEPFWFAVKVTALFAFGIGGPVLLWQMWQFVAAGLYDRERKLVLRYFPTSLLLFFSGILFGYLILVPYGFYYLASTFPPEKLDFAPRLTDFFSLLVLLTVALGVVFQLPALMHVLVRLDLVQRATFAKYRLHFFVGAFIVGAMLTPPDVITQSLLAGPMIVLFEIGLWTSKLAQPDQPGRRAGADGAEADEGGGPGP